MCGHQKMNDNGGCGCVCVLKSMGVRMINDDFFFEKKLKKNHFVHIGHTHTHTQKHLLESISNWSNKKKQLNKR